MSNEATLQPGLGETTDRCVPVDDGERIAELFRRLEYAESQVDVVRDLVDLLGLDERYIAKAASVRPETVTRWLRGDIKAIHARDAINDLRYIVLSLLATKRIAVEGIAYWLSRRDIQLGVEPVEALAAGEFARVVEAGRAYAEGRSTWLPGATMSADRAHSE